jgi:GntR family transcriptional regulator of arabinose operon
MRFNAETPRYVQVRQWIERQIATGYWKSGDVLPPERALAQQLGVSPLTVSRALQGLAREGIVTRKRRVGTVVAENLPPNLLQRSFTIMALGLGGGTRQPVDFYFSSIQRSVLNTLAPLAIRTLWLDYQIDQIERELLSTEFVGVLAMAPAAEHIALLEDLYRRGVPVVIVGASAQAWETPTVDTDNYRAAREGVEYLLGLGHRRFLGLFGALETFNSRDRWRGFRDALHEAGIPERTSGPSPRPTPTRWTKPCAKASAPRCACPTDRRRFSRGATTSRSRRCRRCIRRACASLTMCRYWASTTRRPPRSPRRR